MPLLDIRNLTVSFDTSVGEFFAVATECFFEQGMFLRQFHPQLYDVLRGYYRLDPAVWAQAPIPR